MGARIAQMCDSLGERRQAAEVAGCSPQHLRRIIRGDVTPGVDLLASLADASGYSLDWVMTGRGAPKRGGTPAGTDAELLGRLFGGLGEVYREEGASLPDIELGRIVAAEHDQIVTASSDPAERLVMLKLVLSRHRATLQREDIARRRHGA